MELHKLKILQRQTGPYNHSIAISRACVGTRTAEIRASVAAGRQYGFVRSEPMERAILHVERHNAHTFAVLHDEVKRKILDEEVGVVAEGLAVECVQEGVACAVGSRRAAVGLTALAVFERLSAEGTLVNFAILGS